MIDCGSPPPVDNGDFNVSMTTFESIAEYNCNEGFTLSDSQSRTCQADGTWSGADPVCAQQQNSSSVVIGVVIGLLVAALIALGIVLAVIVRRRQQRSGEMDIKPSNGFNDLTNPIYTGREIYLYN